jgi:hypothetical protein
VEDGDVDVISDHLFSIFQAPTWVNPIAAYIDEHCGVFEDMQENKLEYTPIHNAFKQLVDDLLTIHLAELSVTAEQFQRFCEHGLKGSETIHRSIVEQLLSVDDFLVFKAIMLKRTADINKEVLDSTAERCKAPHPTVIPGTGGEVVPLPEAEADDEEAEQLEAQRRCVEAELQLAIALSLQLEQRLRLVEALEERLRLIEKLTEVMEATAEINRQQEEALVEEEKAHAAYAAAQAAEVGAQVQAELAAQAPEAAAAEEEALPSTMRLQPLLAPLSGAPRVAPGVFAGDDSASTAWSNSADRFTLEQKRTEAALHRANRAPVGSTAKTSAPVEAPASPNRPTEAERTARAEHLRKQRELLLEKKRREREEQLSAAGQVAADQAQLAGRMASERAAGLRPVGGPACDAGRRLAAELSGQAGPCNEVATEPAVDAEAATVAMRQTITRQLRETLRS